MSTGFLITSLKGKLKQIKDTVNQHVLKKLYIYVRDPKNKGNLNDRVSKNIFEMYSSSFQLFPDLDVRIILNELKLKEGKTALIKDFNVDVIIVPENYEEDISTFKKLKDDLVVVYIEKLMDDEDYICGTPNKMYNNVALGGTFDRLHTGHKILLSEALLRCSEKLIVGVTDGEMIKGKKLWELIQPCGQRINAVKTFIKEVDSSVNCEVIPITDMYGPTNSDANLDLLVVSLETAKGGDKVNELRVSNGLKKMDIHVVNLIEGKEQNFLDKEIKVSSSDIRFKLLGTYLRPPQSRPEIPKKPHIIGLTGGMASGKSEICKFLEGLGAGTINCDRIAHELYEPGTEVFSKLVELFGPKIVSENGGINRRELGPIVFKDPKKLEMLNSLTWPFILEKTFAECGRLYKEKKKEIVVLEAAVLIKAGWQERVHEVWATFIPESEALHRIMERNNLTEKEAMLRLQAQSSNKEIIENSNVVFCSLWEYEVTRKQVKKAWFELQNYL